MKNKTASAVSVRISRYIFFIGILSIISGHATHAAQDDFEAWKQMTMDSFQQYKDERDAEFMGFLKQRWSEFKAREGLVRDKTPKPIKMPVAPETTPIEPLPEERIVDHVPPPPPIPEPVAPPRTPVLPKLKGETVAIDFYQTPLTFVVDPHIKAFHLSAVSQKGIREFWDYMSRGDYDPFLAQVGTFQKKLELNDWGTHSLVFQAGTALYPSDRNAAVLFTWFMASKMGFEARAGFQGDRIYLLMPSQDTLYGLPYFTFDGRRYYTLFLDEAPETVKNIYTYKGKYPEADRRLRFLIQHTPLVLQNLEHKKLKFSYQGKSYEIPVALNRTLIDFYKFYPQSDFKLYFEAAMAPETLRALTAGFGPLLEGRTETEAVRLLLHFAQTAFAYETDEAQFHREKYLLPEETLYYPYSDCEDRSFLFAKLVQTFLGNEVIGLHYPGHIATAVRFKTPVPGDTVIHAGQRFTVCDPTYINADIGMAMPKFKEVPPKVIEINATPAEG